MKRLEVNFDGLVGPTHNYAGLSYGNVASMRHHGAVANPRSAALQGLAKMKFLADLGIPQAVLPPHERPAIEALRRFGFTGRDAAVLESAARNAPDLLRAVASASSMWVANAATVTPSCDSGDGRVHFTPANLVAKLHRAIEPPQTIRTLRAVFRDPRRFVIHDPVPASQGCGDEGAANHTRLTPGHDRPGVHLYVFGHAAFDPRPDLAPRTFPSRQSLEASHAVARAHGTTRHAVFARQNPAAIDAGVFHNDVIAVGNEDVLFYHELAFAQPRETLRRLRARFRAVNPGMEIEEIRVPASSIPLADAVRSYVFNSQLVTLPSGGMALIAPAESRDTPSVARYLERQVAERGSRLERVHFLDLRQSMRNGGGPACLRLRVVLTPAEYATLPAGVRLTDSSYARLVAWVNRHYREELAPRDLADPQLLNESRQALDELTQLLGLGSIYPFQLAD